MMQTSSYKPVLWSRAKLNLNLKLKSSYLIGNPFKDKIIQYK